VRVRLQDGTITDLGWVGEGCSISQAATSVMSDLVVGARVPDALELQQKFLDLVQSGGHLDLSAEDVERLEDAIAFEGVAKYPARVKCALLGWMAMKGAVADAAEKVGEYP
jgi:nitrogen fixation NifU-like protein